MTHVELRGGPVVVTGASGFIGAQLVRVLLEGSGSVHAIGRAASDWWRLADVAGRVTHHDLDLRSPLDRSRLRSLVTSIAPSEVFHLAAAPLVAGRGADAAATIDLNVFGSHAVLEAGVAVPGCAVVIVGDAFEYSDRGRALRVADAETSSPKSIHAITRLAASRAAARAQQATGAPISVVRMFSVHGPRDHPQRLVPRLVDAARTGASMPLSDPDVVRDWLHVDDVVEVLLRAAAQGTEAPRDTNRTFNVGSGTATMLGELVATVEHLVGAAIDARWGSFPPTEHDCGYWVADISATTSTLGWAPRATLAEGLARTIAATVPT